MTKQINFPVAAADAAKPGYPGTIRLSGVSVVATRPESVTEAIRGQRGRLLHHRWTRAAGQNETLVSQYFGGFPSRDIVTEPCTKKIRAMTRIADRRMPTDGSL